MLCNLELWGQFVQKFILKKEEAKWAFKSSAWLLFLFTPVNAIFFSIQILAGSSQALREA